MDLSVIVVYYRSPGAMRACLASLPAALAGLTAEVVVVDNDSGDGFADELRRTHPDVRLVANPENVGFARGVNRGLAVARGRAIALLNPDTTVEPGGEVLTETSEPTLPPTDGEISSARPAGGWQPGLGLAVVFLLGLSVTAVTTTRRTDRGRRPR